eukprot:51665-Eustigmatos_ZCMA.PRE.1
MSRAAASKDFRRRGSTVGSRRQSTRWCARRGRQASEVIDATDLSAGHVDSVREVPIVNTTQDVMNHVTAA